MNRYDLTPSPTAAQAEKERAFKKAWFHIAQVHQLLMEAWNKALRDSTQLFPAVDSMHFHASEHNFYESKNSENNFYLYVSFDLVDVKYDSNPPHYKITLPVIEILSMSTTQIQNAIFSQATKGREHHRYKDPDYERQLPSAKRQNSLYMGWGKSNTPKTAPPKADIDDKWLKEDWI